MPQQKQMQYSDYEPTKDLVLAGKLWGVFCEYYEQK